MFQRLQEVLKDREVEVHFCYRYNSRHWKYSSNKYISCLSESCE
jgi:hypothetical protein